MQAVLGSSTPRHAPTRTPTLPLPNETASGRYALFALGRPASQWGAVPPRREIGEPVYYSSGNYEAFARPAKPEGIEDKSAYIVGTGLAGLSAACYLIRDAQMDGSRVHLFERDAEPGGACDGWEYPQLGFTMRGGREMDNHFEVMWDLFRSIPSIEDENMSILDYYYQLNKRDPNYSLCRATVNRGEDAGLDNIFNLSDKACMEIMNLFFTPEEQLDDKPITDYFFRRCARFQLLAVLAHHVRLRELAQRARDEALHPTFRPPRRRAPRLQRTALHPVQPVRIPHPAHGELPERPGRADPSEHRGRRHHVLQHPGSQSSHRGADDMRRGPTRRFTSPTKTCCSSPTAAASPIRPSDRKTSRPSSTPCWKKEPGSTCGDVSHGRIPHSGIRKNSSAIRRSPTG